MRILLIGARGNLGSRVIPALLAYRHEVTAFVRSPTKFQSLISPQLYSSIKVRRGDAFESESIQEALETHGCEVIVSTAGGREQPWREQIMERMIASISSAAIRVGSSRGKPLRAWFIGGLGSLVYPGTGGWKIEDYMPLWTTAHHRQTYDVLNAISRDELEWTLLCVATMRPVSNEIDVLPEPRGHGLKVSANSPPDWQDSWLRSIPLIGAYLNLFSVIPRYTTHLEDVADLIASQLMQSERIGELVGFKEVSSVKSR